MQPARRALRSLAWIALGAVAAGTGCDVYDPALLGAAEPDAGRGDDLGAMPPPPPPDAGADAPPVEPPDTGPDEAGCQSRRPPPRPVMDDSGSDEVFWWVVSGVTLGTHGEWARVGYDLDGRCTTTESVDVDCAPQPGFSPPNDGEDGVDNSFGQSFLPLIDLFVPDWEQKVNDGFRSGRASIVMRVTGWNGELDDPVVDVALVASLPAPDGTPPPRFDGTDEYTINLRGFAAGDITRPLARDQNAYIVDGLMVARPRDGTEIVLSGERAVVPVRLNGVFATALLRADGLRSSGIVAGRWPIDSIFDGIVRAGICPGDELYDTALNGLARAADLSADGTPTPFMSCEAMSVGFGFDAVRVRIAGYEMGPADRSPCEDDAGVPADAGAGPDAMPADAGEPGGMDAGSPDSGAAP